MTYNTSHPGKEGRGERGREGERGEQTNERHKTRARVQGSILQSPGPPGDHASHCMAKSCGTEDDNGGLVGRLHAYPLSHSMPTAAADINDEDARNSSPSRYNHERSQQHSLRGDGWARQCRVLSKRENQDDVMKAARTLAASLVQPSPAQKARRIWNGVVPVGGAGRWA